MAKLDSSKSCVDPSFFLTSLTNYLRKSGTAFFDINTQQDAVEILEHILSELGGSAVGKYDKSPSDKIPLRQNPLQISIQTESPRTQSPPDEIPSRHNPLTKQLFQKTFLDKNPSDKSPSRQNPRGQNPLETNSPQT